MRNGNEMRRARAYLFCREDRRTTNPQSTQAYPCQSHPPLLYTYYAVVSLIVVVLVTTMLWIPFVQLMAEVNVVIAKVISYVNKELIGDTNFPVLSRLAHFFGSQQGHLVMSVFFAIHLIYFVSGDLLLFTGCYIYNLPNIKYLKNVKMWILQAIENLLSFTRKKDFIIIGDEFELKFPVPAHHHHHHH